MKKLVMIMGVQRSGTNVLRRSLSLDPMVAGFNESQDSVVFKDWYLRREASIREFLHSLPGTVLLKPISETRLRTVIDVFEEYAGYQTWVIWIYRDPVNVYHSRLRRWPELSDTDQFVEEWNRRNRMALDAQVEHAARLVVVRYEDFIADNKVFWDLCRLLGIEGEYLFRPDSAGGYRNLPRDVHKRILDGTAGVFLDLEASRRFLPRPKTVRKAGTAEAGPDASRDAEQVAADKLAEVNRLGAGKRFLAEHQEREDA